MMDVSWLDIAISTYFTGLLISLVRSIKKYRGIRKIKTCFDYDLLAAKPHMQSYLIMQPLLWPYYFCIEKSPFVRFSELFFKHYGDPGHTYYGTQGIKNFLNDLVKGKNRYEV
ncbi:MAG: hypothetical protein K2X69_05945, partial [Silvanigrellaceae bacterium]|nr:hypothetical protein [Silvanigrellaceae bacterium]